MKKIKIVSLFIFLFSFLLVIISIYINTQNNLETKVVNAINKQKAFTQEISKNIFYIYKREIQNDKKLENSINYFLSHCDNELNETYFTTTKSQKNKITDLWNKFYPLVENFRKTNRVTSTYSNIILEKIVNDIYNLNLSLIIEFDKLIELQQNAFNNKLNNIRYIQYTIFFLLLSLLIYLFSQIKIIISFIQKFLYTSTTILTNSSIKGLEHIEIPKNNSEILKATNNFNILVDKIDNSIQTSNTFIEHTYKSLEEVEKNIEDILELLYTMHENDNIDKELTKKEDAVIESLEELLSSKSNLKNLQNDLNNLITHSKLKNQN